MARFQNMLKSMRQIHLVARMMGEIQFDNTGYGDKNHNDI